MSAGFEYRVTHHSREFRRQSLSRALTSLRGRVPRAHAPHFRATTSGDHTGVAVYGPLVAQIANPHSETAPAPTAIHVNEFVIYVFGSSKVVPDELTDIGIL